MVEEERSPGVHGADAGHLVVREGEVENPTPVTDGTRYDATVVEIPICTEPRRHRGRNPASELVVTPPERTEADESAATDRRNRRAAGQARSTWVRQRLAGRPLPTADTTRLALLTWIESAPYATAEKAVGLLAIDAPGEGYVDYSRLLVEHIASEPKRIASVALALVAATAEERARQSLTGPTVSRYLDAIERWGYEPTDWEHSQRLTAPSP